MRKFTEREEKIVDGHLAYFDHQRHEADRKLQLYQALLETLPPAKAFAFCQKTAWQIEEVLVNALIAKAAMKWVKLTHGEAEELVRNIPLPPRQVATAYEKVQI